MQPFRKNVAVAIDGGGIKGVMVTRALAILEDHLGRPVQHIFQLAAGTSTGSIISAGIGAGLTGNRIHQLYVDLGDTVFPEELAHALLPAQSLPLPAGAPRQSAWTSTSARVRHGRFWTREPQIDVVITAFDLQDNHTRMIKPWKPEYKNWPVVRAVLASSTVPTYFPIVEGRYVDGGVGSYANPCYLAAFELRKYLKWDPEETTLISFGTGHARMVLAWATATACGPGSGSVRCWVDSCSRPMTSRSTSSALFSKGLTFAASTSI